MYIKLEYEDLQILQNLIEDVEELSLEESAVAKKISAIMDLMKERHQAIMKGQYKPRKFVPTRMRREVA